jgi:hypothetical protein
MMEWRNRLAISVVANLANQNTYSRQDTRGPFMTLETAIPLDFGRDFFDSAETEILSTAFEKAWAFVEFDPKLGALEASKRQSELARSLMALLKLGETNPTSLANSAIRTLHQRWNGGRKKRIPQDSPLATNPRRLQRGIDLPYREREL